MSACVSKRCLASPVLADVWSGKRPNQLGSLLCACRVSDQARAVKAGADQGALGGVRPFYRAITPLHTAEAQYCDRVSFLKIGGK